MVLPPALLGVRHDRPGAYLEAEAAGARGTGIGCFYDDAVHELLGLSGREWQSLYHFSMGMPVDDPRLTTEPGLLLGSGPQ